MGKLPTPVSGKVTHCLVCGSWNLHPLLDMGSQPLAERHGDGPRYPLALLECRSCTLVQLSYVVPGPEVFPLEHPYASGNTRALREHFAGLAAGLSPLLAAEDLVVDIGANDGTLLSCFGARVRRVGVEPTGQAAKCVAKGITVCQEFFTPAAAKAIRETARPGEGHHRVQRAGSHPGRARVHGGHRAVAR